MQAGQSCFLMTGRGTLMPCTFVRWEVSNGYEFPVVASPQGKEYTGKQENLYEEETGKIMLMHRRAEAMAKEGYQIKVRLNGSFRVYQPKKHGVGGGWIVSRVGKDGLVCNCPAHAKSGGFSCKHVLAVCSLLVRAAAAKRAQGKNGVATRYENLATAIHHTQF